MVEPAELWSTDLDLPADSVEFCPARPDVFVVGMYRLNEEVCEREGALNAFHWLGRGDVQQICSLGPLPGVLDIKWEKDLLAAALSDGSARVLHLKDQQLEAVASCSAASCLALSVAWAPGGKGLAVSCSDGSVSLLSHGPASLESVAQIQCHGFEAWCVVWDAFQPHVFYTGGDDCRLCRWDQRCPTQATRTLRRHTMGVTSIAPHPSEEHMLASGSYDEKVLLWDSRSLSTPLAEGQAGGGAWRLRWKSGSGQHRHLLAVAAMHGGACVLAHNSTDVLERLCTFNGHHSMVYGIDWAEPDTLASCSFYDKHLALWRHSALGEE
ncbi:hypothetical protein V5799_015571 [Amblyomma americanum]|uniref:methylated diphthine methylhydrolase n=1 Tax=Amblyomma americanum TaxID=6943 RepID=A0AAQ4F7G2_AMBAM